MDINDLFQTLLAASSESKPISASRPKPKPESATASGDQNGTDIADLVGVLLSQGGQASGASADSPLGRLLHALSKEGITEALVDVVAKRFNLSPEVARSLLEFLLKDAGGKKPRKSARKPRRKTSSSTRPKTSTSSAKKPSASTRPKTASTKPSTSSAKPRKTISSSKPKPATTTKKPRKKTSSQRLASISLPEETANTSAASPDSA